jgi:anti-sigma-K factor RskA
MSPEVHTLAGAYALDAVDDIERAAFARHLAQCPACAQEVAELQATTARLADVVAAPPPARLRAAVLGQIRQTRQVGPWRRDAARSAGQARWRRVALAAAVAVVVAAGIAVGTVTIEEQRVRQARAVAAVLAAPDARTRLAGAPGGGQIKVVLSDSMHEAVAILTGLRPPGAGHSYQLWLIRPGADPIPTGAVLTSGTGQQLLTDLHGASVFAVSREAGTGRVRQPTDVVEQVPLA